MRALSSVSLPTPPVTEMPTVSPARLAGLHLAALATASAARSAASEAASSSATHGAGDSVRSGASSAAAAAAAPPGSLLFSAVPCERTTPLLRQGRLLALQKGAVVQTAGARLDTVYIVLRGSVLRAVPASTTADASAASKGASALGQFPVGVRGPSQAQVRAVMMHAVNAAQQHVVRRRAEAARIASRSSRVSPALEAADGAVRVLRQTLLTVTAPLANVEIGTGAKAFPPVWGVLAAAAIHKPDTLASPTPGPPGAVSSRAASTSVLSRSALSAGTLPEALDWLSGVSRMAASASAMLEFATIYADHEREAATAAIHSDYLSHNCAVQLPTFSASGGPASTLDTQTRTLSVSGDNASWSAKGMDFTVDALRRLKRNAVRSWGHGSPPPPRDFSYAAAMRATNATKGRVGPGAFSRSVAVTALSAWGLVCNPDASIYDLLSLLLPLPEPTVTAAPVAASMTGAASAATEQSHQREPPLTRGNSMPRSLGGHARSHSGVAFAPLNRSPGGDGPQSTPFVAQTSDRSSLHLAERFQLSVAGAPVTTATSAMTATEPPVGLARTPSYSRRVSSIAGTDAGGASAVKWKPQKRSPAPTLGVSTAAISAAVAAVAVLKLRATAGANAEAEAALGGTVTERGVAAASTLSDGVSVLLAPGALLATEVAHHAARAGTSGRGYDGLTESFSTAALSHAALSAAATVAAFAIARGAPLHSTALAASAAAVAALAPVMVPGLAPSVSHTPSEAHLNVATAAGSRPVTIADAVTLPGSPNTFDASSMATPTASGPISSTAHAVPSFNTTHGVVVENVNQSATSPALATVESVHATVAVAAQSVTPATLQTAKTVTATGETTTVQTVEIGRAHV